MVKVLPVNDDNTIPGTVVVVEVATVARPDEIIPNRWLHTFRCGHAFAARMENGKWTREKSLAFNSPMEFWSWLNFVRRAGSPVWLFTSKGGQTLTLLGLWDLLTSGEFVLNRPPHPNLKHAKSHKARAAMMRTTRGLLITGGPPTAVVCYHQTRWKLTAISLENFVDLSQASLCSKMNMQSSPFPECSDSLSVWKLHTEGRCRVSTEAVKRLIVWHAKQELGRFSLTIAGVAMASLRHRFMRDRIVLPEDQDERDWQRDGYFNGRVEALWGGRAGKGYFVPPRSISRSGDLFEDYPRGPFHVIDARSFYGGVCTFCELPAERTEDHRSGNDLPPETDKPVSDIMASVLIDTHTDVYPVRQGAGAMYARGTYWTTLCGPELEHARKHGHIKKWGGWQRFRMENVLRWYAEGFWSQRIEFEKSGDLLMAYLCKSVLARLHGKFIQRKPKWTMLPGRIPPGPWQTWEGISVDKKRRQLFRSIGWDVQIMDDGGDSEFCFPALAAWVTAHGREWLRHWMKVAGQRHVLYVACDSMIVTNEGLANLNKAGLIYPDICGGLKLTSTSDTVEVRGPNNYTHGDTVKVSGRALRALKITGNTWTAERWQGVEELFHADDKATVESYGVTGNVHNFTAPGKVGPGGWIEPPYLSTEDEKCQSQKALQYAADL